MVNTPNNYPFLHDNRLCILTYVYNKNALLLIDYIFLSKKINVLDARALPTRLDINGPMPNENYESDHLLLCSDIEIVS